MLQHLDRHYASTVDSFAANSRTVQERIRKFYGATSRVVYPPCDTSFYTPSPGRGSDYLLAAGRLVPYKRFDLAIEAAALSGVHLIVAGTGPSGRLLQQLAENTAPGLVTFVGAPSQKALRELYRGARALLFPGLEDFGIVPVEAQACGTPVIALAAGGALETVLRGATGLHVREATPEGFASAIVEVLRWPSVEKECVENAARFGIDRFDRAFTRWVESSI